SIPAEFSCVIGFRLDAMLCEGTIAAFIDVMSASHFICMWAAGDKLAVFPLCMCVCVCVCVCECLTCLVVCVSVCVIVQRVCDCIIPQLSVFTCVCVCVCVRGGGVDSAATLFSEADSGHVCRGR